MSGGRDKGGWDARGVGGCSVGNHRKYMTTYESARPILNREGDKSGIDGGSN